MSNNKIEISVKDIPEIIKTLEETEKEIEFERKSRNLFIDDLYKVCETSLKQEEKIKRLKNIIKEVSKELKEFNESYLEDEGDTGVYRYLNKLIEKLNEGKE